jgi:glucosamine kinase
MALDTDAFTTLLGAHGGEPGVIIAVGTGSVGLAWHGGQDRRLVGGWGYPSGDEGSGAWMGLRAVAHLQRTLDGRERGAALAAALAAACGSDRRSLARWLAAAGQTAYATLAPWVLQCAAQDPVARAIASGAGQHLLAMDRALDAERRLPLSLCGGLAGPLHPYLPPELTGRARSPRADAATGALRLLERHLAAMAAAEPAPAARPS